MGKQGNRRGSGDFLGLRDAFDAMSRNLLDVGVEGTRAIADSTQDVLHGLTGDRKPSRRTGSDYRGQRNASGGQSAARTGKSPPRDERSRDLEQHGNTYDQRTRHARSRDIPATEPRIRPTPAAAAPKPLVDEGPTREELLAKIDELKRALEECQGAPADDAEPKEN